MSRQDEDEIWAAFSRAVRKNEELANLCRLQDMTITSLKKEIARLKGETVNAPASSNTGA